MAHIGYGYGSECHLLRFMGRYRTFLNESILTTMNREGCQIEWLDFEFGNGRLWPDKERKGLRFLGDYPDVLAAWRTFWPQVGTSLNWDAVGWLEAEDKRELLLVEAKAHTGEIAEGFRERSPESQATIQAAFDETKAALGVPLERDWMQPYYQYCNRLAALHFLRENGIDAHLLLIYFVGDMQRGGQDIPVAEEGWATALADQDQHVGLQQGHPFEQWIHKIFLPVSGGEGYQFNPGALANASQYLSAASAVLAQAEGLQG